MPKAGRPTEAQIEAIAAAIQRVFPNITEQSFSEEMAWAIRELRYGYDGTINWRSMRVGNLLLASIEASQGRCCYYCGNEIVEIGPRRGTIEHVIRKSDGGLDHPDNLAMACFVCNTVTFNQAKAATY